MTPETIYKLKSLPIVRVGEEVGLDIKKKKALCFNHDDRNPSLHFDIKKNTFHCYVCSFKGDTILLVQKKLGLTFPQACSWLINRFQLVVNESLRIGKKRSFNPVVPPKTLTAIPTSRFNPDPVIYEWLIKELHLSADAVIYLKEKRKFSERIIHQLEIRDMPNPAETFKKLTEKWGVEALLNCGLIKLNDQQQPRNVWWDHVIIFPFLDANHRIVYLQARRLAINSDKWKYVTLSNLKPAIYNLHVLHDIKPGDDLYICEGIPDTITALELNLHAIGVLGSGGFDHEIVDLLLPYKLNIFPDKDEGGRFFIQNVRRAFYERGKTIQERVIPEPYKDLNEYFITKNS